MRQESEPVSYPYCYGLDLDEPMIGCEMREACDNHGSTMVVGEFMKKISLKYCYSVKCAKTNGSALARWLQVLFLSKDRQNENTLVECADKRKCINRRIYHVACVDLDEMHVPDLWFCSTTCYNESTSRSKGWGRKKMSIIVYEGKTTTKKPTVRYVSVIATYHIC